jgi:hypothetical protein
MEKLEMEKLEMEKRKILLPRICRSRQSTNRERDLYILAIYIYRLTSQSRNTDNQFVNIPLNSFQVTNFDKTLAYYIIALSLTNVIIKYRYK